MPCTVIEPEISAPPSGTTNAVAFLIPGFGLLWGLALLPLVIFAVTRAVIRREETYLESKYGDEYRAYKRSVRRWL